MAIQVIINAENALELRERVLDLAKEFSNEISALGKSISLEPLGKSPVAEVKEAQAELKKVKTESKTKAKVQSPKETAPLKEEKAEVKIAEVKIEDVRQTLTALLSQQNGTVMAQQLLSKFGARKLSELAPEKFSAFMAEAQNALA